MAAMAGMLVAAIALPGAFADDALVFGLAFSFRYVRVLYVVMLILDVGPDPRARSTAIRLLPSLLAGPALIVTAAFVDPPSRELLWIVAALIDVGGPLVVGVGGLRVLPAYFVDRHAAIIIIALGETIVQVGRGAACTCRS